MKKLASIFMLIGFLSSVGCSSEPPPVAATPELDPDDPTILKRPFTAEQIRDEWIPGLTIDMRRWTPEREIVERWTVVAADAESVEIEYAKLEETGQPSDVRRSSRSSWVELRDHASFPADRSSVEKVTRETALGTLDGWLYRVRIEADDSVTEYFFARALPGAPVEVRLTRAGQLVMELTQIARQRP